MQKSTQRYARDARQRWIDAQICEWSGEQDASKWRSSETARAWSALANVALDHAEREGVDDPVYYLEEAADVISGIRAALEHVSEADVRERMRLWSHRIFSDDLRRKKFPRIGRTEAEEALTQYLALPYRSTFIDRLLVDLLIAQELYAFAELNLNAPCVPGFFAASPLRRRPIVEWFVGLIVNVLMALALSLGVIAVLPEKWRETANAIIWGLVLISIVWSTVMLPRAWLAVNKAKKLIISLLGQMSGLYSELTFNRSNLRPPH